jgi:hypothetical protein
MLIHGVFENRMNFMKKLQISDFVGSAGRAKKELSHLAEKSVIGFMKDFLADEHGRAYKILNPRSGKEEWDLPIWMNKAIVYKLYALKRPKECTSEFRVSSVSSMLFHNYKLRTKSHKIYVLNPNDRPND